MTPPGSAHYLGHVFMLWPACNLTFGRSCKYVNKLAILTIERHNVKQYIFPLMLLICYYFFLH